MILKLRGTPIICPKCGDMMYSDGNLPICINCKHTMSLSDLMEWIISDCGMIESNSIIQED